MIYVWFIVWWVNHFPVVEPWNGWFIALVICLILLMVNND